MLIAGKRILGVAMCLCSGVVFAQAVIEDINAPAPGGDIAAQSSTPVRRGPSAAAQVPAGTLEERVQRLERMMNNQALIDMLRRLEELQVETQTLRGQVDEAMHELEGMKSRQRDIYLDIDRRMQQLESAPRTTLGQTGTNAVGAATDAAVGISAGSAGAGDMGADEQAARAAYTSAFQILQESRYDDAIAAFQSFIATYSSSSYVDNAHYWLGEANYVTRRFQAAQSAFSTVIKNFPDSSKLPDSLLKLGYTYYEMGRWKEARQALESVKQKYPGTAIASLAEGRLQKMASEGR